MNEAAPITIADRHQKDAANPAVSAWVTASAGTGKTKVLTDRVLRLLLAGADPARILCLTYTNAAAAEMENRILGELAGWAVAAEAKLYDGLAKLTERDPEPEKLGAARSLFAKVLDTPGGLKIETIHGFCQSVLKRFPLEAGVSPHFTVIEPHDAAELRAQALQQVLAKAQRDADGPLAGALETVTALVSEMTFAEVLNDLLARRGKLRKAFRAGQDDVGVLERRIYELLNVRPGETEQEIVRAAVAESAIDRPTLVRLAEAMAAGGKTAQSKGADLSAWLERDEAGRARSFPEYTLIYLTAENERRKKMLDQAAAAAFPDGAAFMEAEAARVIEVLERTRAARTAGVSAALVRFGIAVLDRYEDEKAATARLDFDDLIAKTLELLSNTEAAWVLYKLDGGLDHILIDEAQDTSPEQWDLIETIAEEFFAGEGAERPSGTVERTVFAVGDYKQSIYRFQGAAPEKFREMRAAFRAKVEGAGHGWEEVPLDVSFRSTEAVLDVVDAVFSRPDMAPGVREGGDPMKHLSSRGNETGSVTLWPMLPPPEKADHEPWALPEVETAQPESKRLAAVGIAERIKGWIEDRSLLVWERLDDDSRRQRPVRPGDIMVLVRRRNAFMDYLVAELKARDIEVSGVDRMVLPDQLAVRDLLALARFLLLPEDDLALAEVLRGPFFDFSDEELFDVAHDRKGSLWRALRDKAGSGEPFSEAADTLSGFLAEVDYLPPYDLFAELLEARGGRKRLIRRLGRHAEDPVDEFLALALTYQRLHPPSLQGFVHWVVAGRTEVKRDLEQAEPDEVRIMTVHGAKGLQAPVVILPDTVGVPQEYRTGTVLWHRESGLPLWAPTKDDHDPVTAAERAAQHEKEVEEYRRLLYVAMTRAADHLIVCSWDAPRSPPGPDHWYGAIEAGLRDAARAEEIAVTPGWSGTALVYEKGAPGPLAEEQPPLPMGEFEVENWAVTPAPAEPRPPAPLAPSRPSAEETEPAADSPLGNARFDETVRFRRGLLIHRLLQTLPDLPAGERQTAARRYLAREGVEEAEIEALTGEVMAVLETPEFAPVFAPESMAEVPVTGVLGQQVVSGQIDRLSVTGDEILVVDYKSNRPPPAAEREVAALYFRQMAAYRDLLRQVYPGKPVRCALLWTDGPRLMELSDAALDRHASS